jgi:HAD superfamily hydrolase (TIGR01490 family)
MLPAVWRSLWTAAFYATKGPYFKIVDRISRTRLNVVFYRCYAGLPSERIRSLVQPCFEELLRPSLFEEALACVREHHRAGRDIVFVTGSIDFIMAPLAEHLGARAVLAPTLVERDGKFTGELDGPPVGQTEKARRVRAYAEHQGLDLSASFAYGDSIADVPMLQEVGHPHAVNPDQALSGTARRLGWPVVQWSSSGAKVTTP